MKTIVKVILAAILLAGVVGYGLGTYKNSKTQWSPSMEDATYWQKRDALKVEEARKAASGETKAPKVSQPEIEYDFGVLEKTPANEQGEHDFIIENIGNDTLKLKEKDKTCFCTTFSITKKTLAPGEKTTVKVNWDGSHGGGGDFKQTVVLSTNDPVRPEIFFNVKGLYNSPIVCNPNHLMFTGISNSETHEREFHILGFGQDAAGAPFPLEISDAIVSDPEHFELKIEKSTTDQMSHREKENAVFNQATNLYLGHMTVKPGLPQGAFQEIVQFKTNHPTVPVLELMVEGQVTGSVTVSGAKYDKHGSNQLIIGSVSSRKGASEKIRLDILDKALIATDQTVRVLRQRPDWLNVTLDYPDLEQQKRMPVKMIGVTVEVPLGSPTGNFSGPGLPETGEIVFGIGEGDSLMEYVLPVNFAVSP